MLVERVGFFYLLLKIFFFPHWKLSFHRKIKKNRPPTLVFCNQITDPFFRQYPWTSNLDVYRFFLTVKKNWQNFDWKMSESFFVCAITKTSFIIRVKKEIRQSLILALSLKVHVHVLKRILNQRIFRLYKFKGQSGFSLLKNNGNVTAESVMTSRKSTVRIPTLTTHQEKNWR